MNDQVFLLLYKFSHQSVFMDNLVVFLAHYLPHIVIVLAAILLLFHHEVLPSSNPIREFKKKWREIFLVFFVGVSSWVLAHVLKVWFDTARPLHSLPEIIPLFDKTGNAFPSGHAAFFTALAFAIFFSHKKAGYVFMFFALVIGLARIAAGVHFPVDILGGFVLGILVAYFFKNI